MFYVHCHNEITLDCHNRPSPRVVSTLPPSSLWLVRVGPPLCAAHRPVLWQAGVGAVAPWGLATAASWTTSTQPTLMMASWRPTWTSWCGMPWTPLTSLTGLGSTWRTDSTETLTAGGMVSRHRNQILATHRWLLWLSLSLCLSSYLVSQYCNKSHVHASRHSNRDSGTHGKKDM